MALIDYHSAKLIFLLMTNRLDYRVLYTNADFISKKKTDVSLILGTLLNESEY